MIPDAVLHFLGFESPRELLVFGPFVLLTGLVRFWYVWVPAAIAYKAVRHRDLVKGMDALALGKRLVRGLLYLAIRLTLLSACGLFAAGSVLLAMRFPVPGLLVLGFLAWRRWRMRGGGSWWTHGTARSASLHEIEHAGLLGDDGLILGRVLPERTGIGAAVRGLISPRISSHMACRQFLAALLGRRWLDRQLVRVRDYVHLLTCSPAGGGKGTGVLVPVLRSYRGSCVVTDPKGELFSLTARHRHEKFSHRIIRLDPFNVCGPGSDRLNPFDFIDETKPSFLDDCRALANKAFFAVWPPSSAAWSKATTGISGRCGGSPRRGRSMPKRSPSCSGPTPAAASSANSGG